MSTIIKALTNRIPTLVGAIFYAAVITLVLTAYEPARLIPHPVMLNSLLSGTRQGYTTLGSEIEPFKKFLPKQGTITFLTDNPFREVVKELGFYHSVQNYLSPLILNYRPDEAVAIIYCTSDAIARKRVEETGYKMVLRLAEGKGMAVKAS